MLKKWQVFYRSKRGGFGEIGYKLFDTKEAAEEWGNSFMKRAPWVAEIIVRHPAKVFSNY